jgi:uncharacterized protein (TIGR02147 family)
MTDKSIFRFSDYKTYLLQIEDSKRHKGFRSRIAECTGCQNAFVSQVFNGAVNFSLEQALHISSFLNHGFDEKQYFLWMVEFKRAGTADLRKYFSHLMETLREKNLEIKERAKAPQILGAESQATYYSSWIYSALHIAVMIPKLNTVARLAHALDLPESKIAEAVNFLVENGLVDRVGQNLTSGRAQIHLDRASANINKLHTNWRLEALKSLDHPSTNDLHYSGVSSLSLDDVAEIRAMFVDVIENYLRTVEKSPEETVYTFNLDFFSVIRPST